MPPAILGQPLDRIDGRLKVTGRANYAADNPAEGVVHACGVFSTITAGKIRRLDVAAAERAPGVLAVLHHGNMPSLQECPSDMDAGLKASEARPPLTDTTIHYAGQFIALVVAETFAQARWATQLVRTEYEETSFALTLEAGKEGNGAKALDDEEVTRGDLARGLAAAAARIDHTYVTPAENHAAMELHSTLARWEDGRLLLDDSTQWVFGQPRSLAHVLGVPAENVRVRAPFIGGGFGSKLFLWPHAILAAVAARQLRRPVKMVLPRQRHFSTAGHRPVTRQRIQLAAGRDGRLTAIQHDIETHTSQVTEYVESCGESTPFLYRCPNVQVTHRLIPVNVGSPCPMRGPGTVPGSFALESALDELALELRLDPAELRLRNVPERDPQKNRPWSALHFEDCIRLATERFGWARRDAGIGAMRDGREILGWGFAAATWPAMRNDADVHVELRVDGTARIACATQDIGTGTYTVLAQVLAELTGISCDRIEVAIGDSIHPRGPISGGSMATATLVPAVAAAVRNALEKLPAGQRPPDMPLASALQAARQTLLRGEASVGPGEEREHFSFRCFGAHCVEVRWDPGISKLRVGRVTSVFDTGRIINAKTARNQVEGSIVMGLGMALLEQMVYDPRTGRVVNDNLADYHVPVHADLPAIDVTLLDRPDPHIGELGAKGIGEIGLTGIAAAIANAVHHASGKRIRELPITIEKLM